MPLDCRIQGVWECILKDACKITVHYRLVQVAYSLLHQVGFKCAAMLRWALVRKFHRAITIRCTRGDVREDRGKDRAVLLAEARVVLICWTRFLILVLELLFIECFLLRETDSAVKAYTCKHQQCCSRGCAHCRAMIFTWRYWSCTSREST
jgi:hypothetical protein